MDSGHQFNQANQSQLLRFSIVLAMEVKGYVHLLFLQCILNFAKVIIKNVLTFYVYKCYADMQICYADMHYMHKSIWPLL